MCSVVVVVVVFLPPKRDTNRDTIHYPCETTHSFWTKGGTTWSLNLHLQFVTEI